MQAKMISGISSYISCYDHFSPLYSSNDLIGFIFCPAGIPFNIRRLTPSKAQKLSFQVLLQIINSSKLIEILLVKRKQTQPTITIWAILQFVMACLCVGSIKLHSQINYMHLKLNAHTLRTAQTYNGSRCKEIYKRESRPQYTHKFEDNNLLWLNTISTSCVCSLVR